MSLTMRLFGAVLAFVAPLCATGAVRADLLLCNQTDVTQATALAYFDGDDWLSRGWTTIAPYNCAVPVVGDLSERYYYIHSFHEDRQFRHDGVSFCTDVGAFDISGDLDCERRGLNTTEFAEIDTKGASSWSYDITDAVSLAASRDTGVDAGKRKKSVGHAGWIEGDHGALFIDTGLAQGGLGDPYEGQVFLQSCIFETEIPYCEMIAQGWLFIAVMDDLTPAYVLEAIGELPVNAPLYLQADIIDMGDVTAEIAITHVSYEPLSDPFADLRAALQGAWVLAEDRRYESYVYGSYIDEYLDGRESSSYSFELAHECDGVGRAGPVLIGHLNPWEDPVCLGIFEWSQNHLSIWHVKTGRAAMFVRP